MWCIIAIGMCVHVWIAEILFRGGFIHQAGYPGQICKDHRPEVRYSDFQAIKILVQ